MKKSDRRPLPSLPRDSATLEDYAEYLDIQQLKRVCDGCGLEQTALTAEVYAAFEGRGKN